MATLYKVHKALTHSALTTTVLYLSPSQFQSIKLYDFSFDECYQCKKLLHGDFFTPKVILMYNIPFVCTSPSGLPVLFQFLQQTVSITICVDDYRIPCGLIGMGNVSKIPGSREFSLSVPDF